MSSHHPSNPALRCWCGASDWSFVCQSAQKKFAVLRCPVCRTSRIDPPPVLDETQAEQFYTDYYNTEASAAAPAPSLRSNRSGPFWLIADRVPELRNASGTIAEIGAGDGHRCAELKDAGWPRVIGFEFSKSRAKRAQSRYPDIEIYDSTIQQSGLDSASLQLVLMEAVIEHMPKPLEQTRDIARFLKPGGYFVLTTPNMDSGNFKLLGSRWTPSLAPHVHLFLFGVASIEALLVRAGLQPVMVGSLQTESYEPMDYVRRALSGDFKGALWRAMQETGSFFGRLTGQGPLLFAVGRKI